MSKKSNMTLTETLKLAQSETKFKTRVAAMYYYGTEEEADTFRKKLIKCCKEKCGKR